MPRKKKPPAQPVAIADTLEALKEKLDLKTADQLPARLDPPEPELLPLPRSEQSPPPRELVNPAPEQARPRPSQKLNGQEPESHAAAVLSRRPSFAPVPANFMNVARYESAGIRVNKSHDRLIAAIQFEESRPLSRATEYEAMSRIQDAGFSYSPATRQWQRRVPDGMELGDNVIEATRLAKEIADARGEGRGR